MGNLRVTTNDSVNMQKKQQAQQPKQAQKESVSFFDEAWSGNQIAKLTGDNAVTDWLQNKDKKCTDGKDDGKLSFGQYALSFAKGLIGGIPKAIINHPVATAVTVGLGAAAVAATGGAILPVLGAIGVATGVGMTGYGSYKAATAKTDGEAKQALETIGMGVTTTALSVAAADKALEKAAETGVKSAQVSDDAGILEKTVQMFKATPEALKVGKNQFMSNRLGVTYESYISDGGKVNRSNIEEIHSTANKAINRIVDDANSYGRTLNETDYARIQHIRTQEENLIQKLHLKAQSLDKNERVWLVDANHRQSASIGFGDEVYTFAGDEYYGKPSCVVGSEGYAAKNYAGKFEISPERVSPDEVKLDVWSKQLNQVSHDNWRYQYKCQDKANDILSWYKSASAKNINFKNADADKMKLLYYLKLSKKYSEEGINAILKQFDQAIATKKIELEAINNNNAMRQDL